MKNFVLLDLLVLCCVSFSSIELLARSAVSIESEMAAEAALIKKYPNAKILKQKWCQVSSKKIFLSGMTFYDSKAKDSKDSIKIYLYSVIERKPELKEAGAYRGNNKFADDAKLFWNEKNKSLDSYDIVCQVPGEKEGSIFDGNAVGSFKGSKEYKTKHLCFAIDNMYSNFGCYNYNPKTKKIELSHVQEYAD